MEDKEKNQPEEREERVFYCPNTDLHPRHVWPSTEYAPAGEDAYVDNCPLCGVPCKAVDKRYLNMAKAWRAATGPKDTRRSRYNNWKHGLNAKSFPILAPALPGKFPACRGCEFRDPCEGKTGEDPYKFCPVNIEPLMRLVDAWEDGRVKDLRQYAALNQAKAWQVVQMMFQDVFEKGVLNPKEVRITTSKDGDTVTQVVEWQSNPLLQRIPQFMELLGHTAEQQNVTPKQEQEADDVRGFLEGEAQQREAAAERQERGLKAITDLKRQIEMAQLHRAQDPAVQNHAKQLSSERADDAGRTG